MTKVTGRTRAGADGKLISSPCCGDTRTVYHFSWAALLCRLCGFEVQKNDFDIVEERWVK